MSDKSAENLRRIRAWDAEWDESKHSRADNGQFTSGGGGGGAKKAPEYGGYTPPKFHGTKEQIFKQATAQGKKNAARAAVLANATPVKAKFSKKEQDVLKGTDASEKDIQKLIGQIPHMSDPEAWSRVHDFCFSDEQADQVFKILKSKAAKAAKPAKAAAEIKPKVTAHLANGTNLSLTNFIKSSTLHAPGNPFDPSQAARKIFTDLVKKHKMDPEAICKELNDRDDFYGKFKPWHKLVDGVSLQVTDAWGNKHIIKIRDENLKAGKAAGGK